MFKLKPADRIYGELTPPPDKSITHRAIFLASLANGVSLIRNPSLCQDCRTTLSAMENLGAKIYINKTDELIKIEGGNLREPTDVIDCQNSGTTMRLVSGILAGAGFFSVLTGDNQLRNRPMDRVAKPLRLMGAEIYIRDDKYPPVVILKNQQKLSGIEYVLLPASAQVKSAILLASLFARKNTKTTIIESLSTRDHTENMLREFGIEVIKKDNKIIMDCDKRLIPREVNIPGDISSAAFFIVGALILKNSDLLIKNVGLNRTRTGILEALKLLGVFIDINIKKEEYGEIVGDIHVGGSQDLLNGVELPAELIPTMIDEVPTFVVCAVFARGKTIIRGAKELRYKETDRISAIVKELKKLGAKIEELEDGFIIEGLGDRRLSGGRYLSSYGDHRIAMSLAIASLKADDENYIDDIKCVDISYPNFVEDLKRLCK